MSRFTAAELKVIRVLWEHGELKPGEVQALHPEPIKNPAIRATLTTLVEKEHVARRRSGRAYLYRATTRSRSAFGATLADLVDTFCGGSVQSLMMNIIRAERLSEADLIRLKQLADSDTPQADEGGRS